MRAFPLPLAFALSLAVAICPVNPATAQETDPVATVEKANALCALDADTDACLLATRRAVAIVANAVAEAGNSKDRGSFLAPVRVLLTDPNPEVRTSAAYALAKLGPDADDTPLLISLLRDPISNVRAGAWSAASRSSDPAARLIAGRITKQPATTGYSPDGPPFDPAALGFALPDGAEYLWITADLRDQSGEAELNFLTTASLDQTLQWIATLTPDAAQPVSEFAFADPVLAVLVSRFLDPDLYADAAFVSLPATDTLPQRVVAVYRDRIFGQTGFSVVFADDRSLVPARDAPDKVAVKLDDTSDAAAFDAAMLRRAGFKPEADPDESDLFMAIVAAGGYGAEGYLEVYPQGAYAAEAQAILDGPRLVLGGFSFTDAEDITVRFQNLPPNASANIEILSIGQDYETMAGQFQPDATTATTVLPVAGGLSPGVYLLQAKVNTDDGSDGIFLSQDFSITLGMATLALEKTDFAPGEPLAIRFAGMSGDAQDYLATAAAGAPNASYLAYVYTDGLRDGSATLTAPTTPGPYELRAFFREDETTLRASLPFTVGGASNSTPDPSTPDTPTTSITAPPATPVIPNAGEPDPAARATLVLDKATYSPGAPMLVTFSGMFGDRLDYVATVAAGAPLTSFWEYKYTDGAQSGTASLLAPTAPGAYELRAFFKEDESILRGSVAFTVE